MTLPLLDEYQQMLAAVTAAEARLKIFRDAAHEIGGHIGNGIAKPDAVDALVTMAAVYDFFDVGEAGIERIIGEEFLSAGDSEADREADREMVHRLEEYDRKRERERGDAKPGGNGTDAETKPPRFTLTPFEQITISTKPNYLIKGVIPQEGLTVVWGPPKCGKSFLCFDVAMHIALGRPYRNRRVIQGAVVYLALEGGGGFARRVEAWRQRHDIGTEPVPFHLLAQSVDLDGDHRELIDDIRQAAVTPAVIFIDTLNRALVGDENKSDDMARFIRAADALRAAFGCAVVIIHHCGVAGSRPRGHTSLSGADDAQIAVERDKEGIITVTIEHMKDSAPGLPFACRLELVDLGLDDDGDPITSCIIVPEKLAGAKGPKLTGVNKLAYDQLIDVLATDGTSAPASNHIPRNVRVCPAALWRDHFYAAHAGKADTKQKAFVRATLKLQELHIVGIWGEFAWLPDMPDMGQTS